MPEVVDGVKETKIKINTKIKVKLIDKDEGEIEVEGKVKNIEEYAEFTRIHLESELEYFIIETDV